VILAIDDCEPLSRRTLWPDLAALARLAPDPGAGLTIIQVEHAGDHEPASRPDSCTLALGLQALTVSQVRQYLLAKLRAVGRHDRIFTPRALARLQCLSRGAPWGLERLATLSMMAGAMQGFETIPPDVVDGIAAQCWSSP
jgi:hypothetical protein